MDECHQVVVIVEVGGLAWKFTGHWTEVLPSHLSPASLPLCRLPPPAESHVYRRDISINIVMLDTVKRKLVGQKSLLDSGNLSPKGIRLISLCLLNMPPSTIPMLLRNYSLFFLSINLIGLRSTALPDNV